MSFKEAGKIQDGIAAQRWINSTMQTTMDVKHDIAKTIKLCAYWRDIAEKSDVPIQLFSEKVHGQLVEISGGIDLLVGMHQRIRKLAGELRVRAEGITWENDDGAKEAFNEAANAIILVLNGESWIT